MHREIDLLKRDALTMGGLLEQAIRNLITGLADKDGDLLRQIVRDDKKIDAWENALDEKIIVLLARFQPAADDLRFVLAVMQVNNEMERMADHVKNVARMARRLLVHEQLLGFLEDLRCAAVQVLEMVSRALNALIDRDVEAARWVRQQDHAIDALCDESLDKLIAAMQSDSSLVPFSVQAISASRNLERVADRATNIAKDVLFLVEGQIVRHGGRTVEEE